MRKVAIIVMLLCSIAIAMPVVHGIAQGPKAVDDWFQKLSFKKEKLTKLNFYLHDTLSGKNPTAIKVAQANITFKSPTLFGLINMIDDPLTVGPEPNSTEVGRAQGFYGSAGLDKLGLIMTMNLYFTTGKYNGSTLSVVGRNSVMELYREMPIIGGSGVFRLARGIVTAKTYFLNTTTGDAVVEYNVDCCGDLSRNSMPRLKVVNPYVKSADLGGSKIGSAVSVAANMVTVSLGTETAGSILCPSSFNAVVGIKPTVGLTSQGGVVPISTRQDTVRPICRTVSDAVYVLDAIVGFDPFDAVATRKASKYIPHGGYVQFLKSDGLRGKRLGITSYPFVGFPNDSKNSHAFEPHFNTLRGATLVQVLRAEFKLSLNAYLKELLTYPVRSLADAIAFNKKFSDLDLFLKAEKTIGMGELEKKALGNLTEASKNGLQKLMKDNILDALVTPLSYNFRHVSGVLAIGGFPGISVPAGYDHDGRPFGICFGGLKGFEPKLIEITYSFEQATKIRKPPSFGPCTLMCAN
ncbi:unnamed protein product [Camellia sinensis]